MKKMSVIKGVTMEDLQNSKPAEKVQPEDFWQMMHMIERIERVKQELKTAETERLLLNTSLMNKYKLAPQDEIRMDLGGVINRKEPHKDE